MQLSLLVAALASAAAAAVIQRAPQAPGFLPLAPSPDTAIITCIDSGLSLTRTEFYAALAPTCGYFAAREKSFLEPHAFSERYDAPEEGGVVLGFMLENSSPQTLEMTEKLCMRLADSVYAKCTVAGEGTKGGYIQGPGWKVMFDPVEMAEADE